MSEDGGQIRRQMAEDGGQNAEGGRGRMDGGEGRCQMAEYSARVVLDRRLRREGSGAELRKRSIKSEIRCQNTARG